MTADVLEAPAAPAAPAPPSTILGTPPAPSPNAAPAPASNPWAKEDGTFAEKWVDRLPEDLRTNPSLLSIGSVQDLAKSYALTKAMVGKKLEMPGEGAPPEVIAEWRKTLGVPEKPEGYLGDAKTLRPDTVPEALWDPEAEKGFLALAHKHHITPAAVKEILGYHANHVQKALGQSEEAEKAALDSEIATLKTKWGNDFDAKVNIAARMARTVGLDPAKDPIFANSKYVEMLVQFAGLITEDKLVKGDPAAALGGSLQERINDITSPSSTSYHAKAYRGEISPQAQAEAQQQLHNLYAATQPQK
jgi:hypothetical protein